MKKMILTLACLLVGLSGLAQAANIGDVAIHGFVSQGYLKTDDVNYLADTTKGTYQFNEAGINFNYTRDKLRVGAQFFSRDLGDFGNNDVLLDWGMGEYRLFDELGFRAGRCKMPVGFYNQGRDVDILRTPIFLPNSVYDESMRDVCSAYNGFAIFGAIDAKFLGGFEYEAYVGGLNMDEDSLFLKGKAEGIDQSLKSSLPPGLSAEVSNMDFEAKSTGGATLRWETPLPGLRLGATYNLTKMEITSDMMVEISPLLVPPAGMTIPAKAWVDAEAQVFVYSGEFSWRNLILAGEYFHMRIPATDNVDGPDLGPMLDLDSKSSYVEHEGGWYASASYQFLDWFTAGLYYSEFYRDLEDKDGQWYVDAGLPASYGWQKEWVPTLRFDPVKNWVIKGEIHFVDGSARCYDFNNPNGRPDDWTMFAIKTSYSF
ncbi:MAG: hypothetical protein JEZ02_00435 [Desulfatibacillum sp.]|nr:hypothetical protein [Desulfatibacillum sp.]